MGGFDKLIWDPGRFIWEDGTPLMKLSAKQWRECLRQLHHPENVVEKKWSGVLSNNHRLKWLNVWDKQRL